MQELNISLKRSGSTTSKYRLIRDLAGGNCSYCYVAIPNKKVSYDLDGGKLVEWFCDPCWEKHKDQLDKRLENMNFT